MGHKWLLPTCRFPVVAPFQGDFWYYKMDGWWGGGGGGESLRGGGGGGGLGRGNLKLDKAMFGSSSEIAFFESLK